MVRDAHGRPCGGGVRAAAALAASSIVLLFVIVGAAGAQQDSPKISVEVDGNPIQSGGHISVPDTPIADTSAPIEVAITNTGSAPLVLDKYEPPGLDGDGSMMYLLDTSTLEPTIDPGENASFTVVFFPYQTGMAQATLIIATNDPETPKFTIDFSGRGTPMADP